VAASGKLLWCTMLLFMPSVVTSFVMSFHCLHFTEPSFSDSTVNWLYSDTFLFF